MTTGTQTTDDAIRTIAIFMDRRYEITVYPPSGAGEEGRAYLESHQFPAVAAGEKDVLSDQTVKEPIRSKLEELGFKVLGFYLQPERGKLWAVIV
jgi:hypothetical protein